MRNALIRTVESYGGVTPADYYVCSVTGSQLHANFDDRSCTRAVTPL